MQHGNIGGPYAPLYPEVVKDLARQIPNYAARWIYAVLITLFTVDEDWGDGADWIAGVIYNTTKIEIMRKSGVGGKGRGGFRKAWQELLDGGLVVEQADKSFRLPYFKKKRYDAISPREVRERLVKLEQGLEQLHKSDLERSDQVEASSPPSDEDLAEKRSNVTSQSTDLTSERSHVTSERAADIIIGSEKKKTLSLIDIVNVFYRGLGQQKISKRKREKSLKVLRKLIQDGFEPEDIRFAAQWTLENATEEPYDLAILEHTIGQAMAARSKQEAQAEATSNREKERREKEEEQEQQEAKREEIEAYKENLDAEARAQLRKSAEEEISSSTEYKHDFVSDILIEAVENNILWKRLDEEGDDREIKAADSKQKRGER